jgi:hypothetical protein
MISAKTNRAYRSPTITLSRIADLEMLIEQDPSLELEECEFCGIPTVSRVSSALRDSFHPDLRNLPINLFNGSRKVTIPGRTSAFDKTCKMNNSFVAGAAGSANVCGACQPRARRFSAQGFRPLNPDLPVMVAGDSSRPDAEMRFTDLETADEYARGAAKNVPAPRKARKARKSSRSGETCSAEKARGSGVVRAGDAREIAKRALELLGLEMPETAAGVPKILEALELEAMALSIVKRETGATDPYSTVGR